MQIDAKAFLESLYEPATVQADVWARRAAALLATIQADDLRTDLRELFEHRTGVCEYCGNQPRDEAERLAYLELQDAVAALPTDERKNGNAA